MSEQTTQRGRNEVYVQNGQVHVTGQLGEAIERLNALGSGTLDVGLTFAPDTPEDVRAFVSNAPNDLIHAIDAIRGLALDHAELDWAAHILAADFEERRGRRTWRDVKLVAHRAGWKIARDRSTVQQVWRVHRHDEEGFPDPNDGLVLVTFDPNATRGRWKFEFTGPGYRNTARLVDPSPAKVIDATRLVGLRMEQP